MPIRIMHVVDSLSKGGLENGVVNLINRMDPVNFEHTVYAIRELGSNAERLPQDRVRILCQGKQDADSRIQIANLARAIRKIKPDIVHSRNWAGIEAVLAGRLVRSCAVMHSEHGLEADAAQKEPWRRNWFRRIAYELADRVLSVSYQLRDLHSRRTGFSARRITVIHNGVDVERFSPNPAVRTRIREELGIAEDEFCIGCVGNLLPVKDHLTVLRAASGLAESWTNWRLMILGEGPERQQLESFLEGHPECKNHISLPGISHRVPEMLQAMDVYLLSSVAEGISNSLLEGMASGLPVLATAVGGNPEVVVDGESGLLFPAGDAARLGQYLSLLRGREELRRRLADGAVRRVREEFSLDSMVCRYEQVYEGLKRTAAVPQRVLAGA